MSRHQRNHVDHDVSEQAAAPHNRLADLHAHFLGGDPSWFTRTIGPSARGASEVRREFADVIGRQAKA